MKWDALEKKLLVLQDLMESREAEGIRRLLAELVPEYSPANGLVDWGVGGGTPASVTRREFGS